MKLSDASAPLFLFVIQNALVRHPEGLLFVILSNLVIVLFERI